MAKFATSMKMEVSKSVPQPGSKKKKHQKVGDVLVPVPTLQDFGITAKQYIATEEDAKADPTVKAGQPVFSDGVPVYDDPRANWLQEAVAASVKAMARNRLQKGSTELKPGMQFPEDFEMLTAETARTGEALKLRREAKASFEEYLASLNKKQATIQLLGDLFFNSSKNLVSAGDKYVEALAGYTNDWLDKLSEDKKARFAPKIAELQESINNASSNEAVDDEDIAYNK